MPQVAQQPRSHSERLDVLIQGGRALRHFFRRFLPAGYGCDDHFHVIATKLRKLPPISHSLCFQQSLQQFAFSQALSSKTKCFKKTHSNSFTSVATMPDDESQALLGR